MPYNLSSDLSVKYAELERAAREISIHLPGWEFMKENQINYLRNGEYCILISEDRTGKRIQIQASAHLDKSLGEERGGNDRYFGEIINRKVKDSYTMEITVSANKEPSAIARDIQKRLIPDYIELYERCKKIYLERKNMVDQRNSFGKKIADLIGVVSSKNDFLDISHRLTIGVNSVSIDCEILHSNVVKIRNVSDELLLEILTLIASKANSIYEAWVAEQKAIHLLKLEEKFGITELPSFHWRKAYDERWNDVCIAEDLELAISQSQTEDFMVVDEQELELTATNINYEDDDCDDGDNEEVSDRVLELLAHIESLNLGVIDILELINRLTAIAVNLLEQEEPDTDDDEEYDEDEDQE
jgi:hypothetical protein